MGTVRCIAKHTGYLLGDQCRMQADDHSNGIIRIRVIHYGAGPALTAIALNRLVELSHTPYCAVSASLKAEMMVAAVVEPWEDEPR